MNRIPSTFEALRRSGRQGLVGYLTAGDPDLQTSERNVLTAVESGLDVLELGVPFSDPTADGPTIQAASQRALAAGTTVASVLTMVRRIRRSSEIPIVLFGYANPLFRYGYERVCADAADAGADAMLVVDLPVEEAGELHGPLTAGGLSWIPLIAPTTPADRARTILSKASGFVYYIMVRGVTGARSTVAADVSSHIAMLRKHTPLPIAAGFGVSTGGQARQVAAHADAVVVGSALVQAAREDRLAGLVRELRSALG
jgi:tryptophan synthase alpha chain